MGFAGEAAAAGAEKVSTAGAGAAGAGPVTAGGGSAGELKLGL